ncbi:MAG: hypothetical protein J6W09_01690 [Bacteroidales bacterium]|nr:hypothetical protein [Bacteroidales bacterium]
MKVSLFKSLLVVAATVVLFASCSPKQESVRVGLDATAPSFANGKVDLIVALSGQSATNVGVTLTASGSIPASSLTFEKNPSIPAGTTSKTVSVTVDESTLEPGDYEATFSISSVTGADINVAKQSVTVKLTVEAPVIIPEVSIPSYSEAFTDNKASFKVALDKAIDSDVVVNFEVKTDLGEYEAVPAEALSFSNPLTIAAGTTEFEVEVTLDPTAIAKGVSSYAAIAIASVSENAKVASRKIQTYIEAFSPLQANLRSDWSVTFAGEYTATNGNIYHEIDAAGMGENGTYYIFIYEKGLVASEFEDISEYLQYMEENAVGPNLGTENAYQIKKGEEGWLYNKFSVGEYEIWLAGCREDGHLTGDYTTSTFAIEPTQEMKDAYNKFLGEWILDSPTLTWTIKEKVFGSSYTIEGLEGLDWPVEALLNEDLQLEIHAQKVADSYSVSTDDGTFDCTVGLYGIDDGEGYYWTGTYTIAYGAIDEDGNIQLTGGKVSGSSGSFGLKTMIFIAEAKNGKGAWSLTNSACNLPNVLINPDNIEKETTPVVSASFNDFIGTWVFNGYPIEIKAGETENTYVFSIDPELEAVAKYEDGALVLYDQILSTYEETEAGYGTCADFIGGIFAYGGKQYTYYMFNNSAVQTEISKIFTAQLHESGNITLLPGECKYGEYIGFSYSWVILNTAHQYYGNGGSYVKLMFDIVKPYVEEPQVSSAALRKAASRKAVSGKFVRPRLRARAADAAEGLSTL